MKDLLEGFLANEERRLGVNLPNIYESPEMLYCTFCKFDNLAWSSDFSLCLRIRFDIYVTEREDGKIRNKKEKKPMDREILTIHQKVLPQLKSQLVALQRKVEKRKEDSMIREENRKAKENGSFIEGYQKSKVPAISKDIEYNGDGKH